MWKILRTAGRASTASAPVPWIMAQTDWANSRPRRTLPELSSLGRLGSALGQVRPHRPQKISSAPAERSLASQPSIFIPYLQRVFSVCWILSTPILLPVVSYTCEAAWKDNSPPRLVQSLSTRFHVFTVCKWFILILPSLCFSLTCNHTSLSDCWNSTLHTLFVDNS